MQQLVFLFHKYYCLLMYSWTSSLERSFLSSCKNVCVEKERKLKERVVCVFQRRRDVFLRTGTEKEFNFYAVDFSLKPPKFLCS